MECLENHSNNLQPKNFADSLVLFYANFSAVDCKVDISNFSNGLYIMQIQELESIFTFKVVKQ